MGARLFAYNSGATVSGASQSGNLAVSNNSQGGGSVQWWNGPDETNGYVIGYPDTTGQRKSGGVLIGGNAVGFRRTLHKTDPEFLSLASSVSGQSFLTASVAAEWLNTNGYYCSYAPDIIRNNLVFNLDSAPTSGTTWTDSTGNGYNATLFGSASYVSTNGGGIKLNNLTSSSGTDYISVPYNISSNTVTIEILASFNPTSVWAAIWANESLLANLGYYAYLGNATIYLNWGKPLSAVFKTITASNSVRHWVFVINGTTQKVYINNSLVGTADTVVAQNSFANNNLYFGARHSNNGSATALDKMNNSNPSLQPVFYQMRVYNTAFSDANVSQNYNSLKSKYPI